MTIALDLDGTIVDCKCRQVNCLRIAAKATGQKVPHTFWKYKRMGLNNRQAMDKLKIDNGGLIDAIWRDIIEDHLYLVFDKVHSGVINKLGELKRNGHRVICVTARHNEYIALQQLLKIGLYEYFDYVGIVSPHAAVSVQKAEILAEQHVDYYIGDSEVDFMAAVSAGVSFIWVSNGQRSPKFIKNISNFPVCRDLSQALGKIQKEISKNVK